MEKVKVRWLAEIIGYTDDTPKKMIVKVSTKSLTMMLAFFFALLFAYMGLKHYNGLPQAAQATFDPMFYYVIVLSLLLYSVSIKAFGAFAKALDLKGKKS